MLASPALIERLSRGDTDVQRPFGRGGIEAEIDAVLRARV